MHMVSHPHHAMIKPNRPINNRIVFSGMFYNKLKIIPPSFLYSQIRKIKATKKQGVHDLYRKFYMYPYGVSLHESDKPQM